MLVNLLSRPYSLLKTINFSCSYRFSRRCNSDNVLRSIELQNYEHHSKVAVKDTNGAYTYNSILSASRQLAQLMRATSGSDLKGERVSYIASNDANSLVSLLALWHNESIGVPLCSSHPTVEKQYYVDDSQASLVVGSAPDNEEIEQLCKASGAKSIIMPQIEDVTKDIIDTNDYTVDRESRALIIYTSGTTGRPKGVVLSHTNVWSTMVDMIKSWEWTSSDVCLHALPLHHIHGLVNALLVPLATGASVHMMPKFSAKEFWEALLSSENGISVVTAVPTMYAKLLEYHNSQSEVSDLHVREACQRIRVMMVSSAPAPLPVLHEWEKLARHRLKERFGMTELMTIISNPLTGRRRTGALDLSLEVMISGSSSLSLPLHKSWQQLSGHSLLERYGMTEILMAITNSLYGDRVTGTIGLPFSSVQTMLAQEDASQPHGYIDVTNKIDKNGWSDVGELYVKGPTVFKEYWNRPEATRDTFTEDGWFKTGDTMQIDNGYYKILGRTSVDIIKSGGYKLSALDIESKLLLHPDITECVVIGKPDLVYGQTIAVVLASPVKISVDALTEWCSPRMPKYHIPRTVLQVETIPRNAMGKVNKKSLVSQYFEEHS